MGTDSQASHPPDAPGGSRTDEVYLEFLQLAQTPAGTVINDRYRVERTIGKGGFGIVLAAVDTVLQSAVALKFLDPRHTRDSRKFLRVQREINIARRITDAHVAKIFSLEQTRGLHFLVMELLDGRSLGDLLREKGRFRWPELQPLFLQILDGVAALHRENIIHRDLKPSNIMVDGTGQVKLLDFGLAKELTDNESTSSVGELVGSPYYMSPEQIAGREPDQRSDIYQLGLVLYKSLSGAHPYENSTTMELMVKHLNERPPAIGPDAGLPRHVRFVVGRALEKKKQNRFADVGEMRRLLESGRVGLRRWLRGVAVRQGWRVGAAALLAVAVLGGVWRLTIGSPKLAAVRIESGELVGCNRIGRTLWRRDFAPFGIVQAFLTRNDFDVPERIQDARTALVDAVPRGHRAVVAFLTHPRRRPPSDREPITSTALDNQLAVLDEHGEVRRRKTFFEAFFHEDFDYSRAYNIEGYSPADFDGDGRQELLLRVHHYQMMFPTALAFLKGLCLYTYTASGNFDSEALQLTPDGRLDLLLVGSHNLLAHTAFMAEVSFDPRRPIQALPPFLSPEVSASDPGRLWIIPQLWPREQNRWFNDGRIGVHDPVSGRRFTLWRGSPPPGAALQDPPDPLRQVFGLLGAALRRRMTHDNPKRALELLDEAAAVPIRNPHLRSVILALQGDLHVLLGDYEAGRRCLGAALQADPVNPDALQRLCEIEFLRGDPLASLERIRQLSPQAPNFWGLAANGVSLFRAYAYLQTGRYSEAQVEFGRVSSHGSFPYERFTLQALPDLFQGRYGEVLQRLRQYPIQKNPTLLDLREWRLLLARAMVLTERDLETARFFLADIRQNSYRFAHLTGMSLAWLLARQGRAHEARTLAVDALATMGRRSRGDMNTRLWLFYDAFLYGDTMERLGERSEARRGFELCLAANPYTALAAEARRRLIAR